MSITQGLNWVIRQKSELEQNVVSVERVEQYNGINVEKSVYSVDNDSTLDKSWPMNGKIEFCNVYMKYRPELTHVLKGLTFTVNGGEKVGCIGRTGAGKSSVFLCLLRLVLIDTEYANRNPQNTTADGKIKVTNTSDSQQEKNSSCIKIDDVDIYDIGLQELRKRVSVIPQDPILFTGSIRFNLDPFDEHSDEALIEALRLSHVLPGLEKQTAESKKNKREEEAKKEKEKQKEEEKKKNKKKSKNNKKNTNDSGDDKSDRLITETKKEADDNNDEEEENEVQDEVEEEKKNSNDVGINVTNQDILNFEVSENGSNFSVGQRQLLCLARAIVRKSKVLLLDEATSAVDPQTDQLIQETIRKVFSDNTILTIAHRIDTILDYDKILILDQGSVLEYDTVDNLLNNSQSKFSDIVKSSFGVNLKDVLKAKRPQNNFQD